MERKEEIINKKVWVLEDRKCVWKPIKEKTWIVKDYIDWGDERLNGDYCPHLILEDAEGNTKDIREWEVVVVPDETLPEVDKIYKYLKDNRLWNDDIDQPNKNTLVIGVSWGDWKHDHIYLNHLMSYLDYICVKEIVTEENGSDCYSANHYFIKNAA